MHLGMIFPNYAAGTWGSAEADELLARGGRAWQKIGDEQPSSTPVPAAVGRATARVYKNDQ